MANETPIPLLDPQQPTSHSPVSTGNWLGFDKTTDKSQQLQQRAISNGHISKCLATLAPQGMCSTCQLDFAFITCSGRAILQASPPGWRSQSLSLQGPVTLHLYVYPRGLLVLCHMVDHLRDMRQSCDNEGRG
ncbi:hypothetical protein FVEG_08012 [Fusarium verticillioides 7600]|uniref:Uncharacterized protein n=1 Tax=Gibberella moniliformis (strain M3125 / FGSC 7600) TaxID=334819 RepID=W7MUM4_GIBM7|nr:hypothetical protein FVEG_08012 [Fusarium verticillioides 7600]EWG48102.1 hypothetical protein FVEG_08012 [Fusarium verticillioides 7600]